MKKRTISILQTVIFVFSFSFLFFTSSAQDSSHLRISLLTCSPGDELYSSFGHSAVRIVDSSQSFNDGWRDVVYNYGTFDFEDPDFYTKFIKGKLLYFVSAQDFEGMNGFKANYMAEKRGITEQVLNLTGAEKITVQQFLNNNLKDENKYYKYDFFFDNCTTRLKDILKKNHDSSFTNKAVMPVGTTFRQAIYQYLDKKDKQWSKLGIDILLGVHCDRVMTTEQMEFLPDNLMKSLDSADHSFVLSSQELIPINNNDQKKSLFTPLVLFSLLLVAVALLSLLKSKAAQQALIVFDGLLFFVTGLLGILLLFMWYGTDHSMTKSNFNLLWAWPTHILVAFLVNSNKSLVKKYFAFTSVSMVAVLFAWFFLRQHLNVSLIPIVLLLIYRSATKVFFENK